MTTFILYCIVFIGIFVLRAAFLEGWYLKKRKDGRFEFLIKKTKSRWYQQSIGLSVSGIVPFIAERERWHHKLSKALGLVSEIQTGDRDFDNAVFFVSDHPAYLQNFLQSPKLANLLVKLFQEPVKALRASEKRLWVDITIKSGECDSLFPLLQEIAEEMQRLAAMQDAPRTNYRRLLAYCFISIHAALFILAFFGLLPIAFEKTETLDMTKLVHICTALAAPIAAAWFGILCLLFVRTAWFTWVASDFLLFGLAGILLSTAYVVREANIAFDVQPPVIIEQKVIARLCKISCKRGGRRSTTHTYSLNEAQCGNRPAVLDSYRASYSACRSSSWFSFYLTVPAWAEYQKEAFRFDVTESVYDHTPVGSRVTLPLREGYFAIPWVDIEKIVPAAPGSRN